MSKVKRFEPNTVGRDFVTGDVHGHFTRLQLALDSIGFDPACDRLFQCGDLVDRGPESHLAIEWLAKPWFHPVRGNHDDYVCRFDTCDTGNWLQNGGLWFAGMSKAEQLEHQVQFKELPIAIEVATATGETFGIVHAECPRPHWGDFLRDLDDRSLSRKDQKLLANSAMWSRRRYELNKRDKVQGVDWVLVGHQPLEHFPTMLGNTLYLDTMGWRRGVFSFLNITEFKLLQAGVGL
ncbi:metallophosphoesterase [Pseudomonas sp. NPDC090202]|uniref:metallophosphoesterase n=1 Tax=Pseudomonas sp. NPDC090202 TaxID=3364476 RepID=UPI00381809E1